MARSLCSGASRGAYTAFPSLGTVTVVFAGEGMAPFILGVRVMLLVGRGRLKRFGNFARRRCFC